MRVLHLFSNSKWTGPAEPALNLCVALRSLGVACDFACAPGSPRVVNKIAENARKRGMGPILELHLHKHRHPIHNLLDARRLDAILSRTRYDLIHCHLDNDHRIALKPARRRGVPIVRSSYDGEGLRPIKDRPRLLAATDFLIQPSLRALEHDATTYRFSRERMAVVPGAVDTARFDPNRVLPDARRRLGLSDGAFVAGIVARVQRHRHFEDLWEATRRLLPEFPNLHIVVVGRGTWEDTVARRPVSALGIGKHVHFAGYAEGDDYVALLKAFDIKVFLVPGTDGTCRAVREAMAMGKPVVAADRGMLSEIVKHEQTGLMFDGSVEGLFTALRRFLANPEWTLEVGTLARETALREYSLEIQAKRVVDAYHVVVEKH